MSRWKAAKTIAASLRVGMVVGLGAGLSLGCAPDDPFDLGQPRSCEIPDQNEWVYRLMQETYLFADDLPQLDPSEYESPHEMIRDLRVSPDRWSRVSDKGRSDALFQEGKTIGLGFRTRRDEDNRVVIAQVSHNSPASAAGMVRGDVIAGVAGLTSEEIEEQDAWSGIFGENNPGVAVSLVVEHADGSTQPLDLVKDWIDIETVPVHRIHEVDGQPVGYLLFETFVAPATEALDEVFAEFNEAGVQHVVVDVRYNGGGLISVARHFMHLLVGDIADGKTAYRIEYNSTLADENDERALGRLPHSLRDVQHVVFITTGSSLSASELLLNSVAPHVQVSLVGGRTGGKPVGSRHFDFCDSVAAPITFKLVNADGFGEYYDGFEPTCAASDDLSHDLGDAEEASLAVALHRAVRGECMADPAGEEATVAQPLGLRTRSAASEGSLPELGGLR